MDDRLKKEISDGLTRRITFMPFTPINKNNFDSQIKKHKKIMLLFVILLIVSFLVTIFCLFNYLNTKENSVKIINDINVSVSQKDRDFITNNETKDVYLPNLIDKISIDFVNDIKYSNYAQDRKVNATVYITDANDDNVIIFKNSDSLIYKNGNDNKASVSIDYSKYNEMVNKYKKKINLATNSKLVVEYVNNVTILDKKKTIRQKVIIPLSVSTVDITKEYDNVSYMKFSNNNYKNLYIALFAVFVFIFSAIILVILVRKSKNKLSVLEKKYNKIMKNYNSIIIEVENDDFNKSLTTINIKYFVDLIDAQQELHIPILCYTNASTETTNFYIVTDKYVYKYVLNKTEEQI